MAALSQWHDCGEGPWEDVRDAAHFAHAEVGATYRIVPNSDGLWVVEVLRDERREACIASSGRTVTVIQAGIGDDEQAGHDAVYDLLDAAGSASEVAGKIQEAFETHDLLCGSESTLESGNPVFITVTVRIDS
jgi:hypothetical protein